MHVLVELINGLDVIVGKTEPGQELQLLEALHDGDVVAGQVQDFDVTQFGHLEHSNKPVVLN